MANIVIGRALSSAGTYFMKEGSKISKKFFVVVVFIPPP
jgi:hypothetical protein